MFCFVCRFVVLDKVACTLSWPGTYFVGEGNLEFLMPLTQVLGVVPHYSVLVCILSFFFSVIGRN